MKSPWYLYFGILPRAAAAGNGDHCRRRRVAGSRASADIGGLPRISFGRQLRGGRPQRKLRGRARRGSSASAFLLSEALVGRLRGKFDVFDHASHFGAVALHRSVHLGRHRGSGHQLRQLPVIVDIVSDLWIIHCLLSIQNIPGLLALAIAATLTFNSARPETVHRFSSRRRCAPFRSIPNPIGAAIRYLTDVQCGVSTAAR